MKKSFISGVVLVVIMSLAACAQTDSGSASKKVKLQSELDSVSYAMGVNVASGIYSQGMREIDLDALVKGFDDVFKQNDLLIPNEETMPILNQYFMSLSERLAAENLEKGLKFLEENGQKAGILTTESGLQYEILKGGTGPQPVDTSFVTVHYHGTLLDGTVFDSSVDRGEPTSFALNRVIPGWTEGVQLMQVGSKFKFYIPSELAYGSNPRPGGPIGPNEVLIFEVELLEIGE
jgi:FKBP-type peptidyl-prolyl cis-trans isomerase